MSLKSLVAPVLPRFPQVSPDTEVDVLHDLPVETLYLALKGADAELVHWFFRNAEPRQVQALIDIDCWQGDVFLPERFELFFRSITDQPAPKLAAYTKQLDSEVLVRGLLELCEVRDFDAHEPIDLPERSFLLSPDSKYVLLLLTDVPETREMLFQWMNRLAAADIELLRRTLESMKWEQKADLEDFGYQVKKGRLEEMGFVDYHESLALYARGAAGIEKKRMLDNPLDLGAKTNSVRRSKETDDDGDEYDSTAHSEFLPEIIAGPLSQEGFLAEAFRRVKDAPMREVLLMELLRTVNGALSADRLLHSSLEEIGASVVRTRRYLDFGLSMLSDHNHDRAAELLERQPLDGVFRLGWLAVQDLVKAASDIAGRAGTPATLLFHENDTALLEALRGRHPEIPATVLQDVGLEASWIKPEPMLKLGLRLAQLASIGKYLQEDLGAGLELKTRPVAPFDTALGRLMAGLLRQSAGRDFSVKPLGAAEWPELAKAQQPAALEKAVELAASRCPEPGRSLLLKRLKGVADDLRFQMQNGGKFPDRRFFKGLSLDAADSGGKASN